MLPRTTIDSCSTTILGIMSSLLINCRLEREEKARKSFTKPKLDYFGRSIDAAYLAEASRRYRDAQMGRVRAVLDAGRPVLVCIYMLYCVVACEPISRAVVVECGQPSVSNSVYRHSVHGTRKCYPFASRQTSACSHVRPLLCAELSTGAAW